MKIEQRTVGKVVVLSITGDIAMNETGGSRLVDHVRKVLHEGHNRIVLDLGHVRYVDSTGLGDIVEALAAVLNRGGALKLLNVTRRINDLLAITRLLTTFECFEQETEALASFEPSVVPRWESDDPTMEHRREAIKSH